MCARRGIVCSSAAVPYHISDGEVQSGLAMVTVLLTESHCHRICSAHSLSSIGKSASGYNTDSWARVELATLDDVESSLSHAVEFWVCRGGVLMPHTLTVADLGEALTNEFASVVRAYRRLDFPVIPNIC